MPVKSTTTIPLHAHLTRTSWHINIRSYQFNIRAYLSQKAAFCIVGSFTISRAFSKELLYTVHSSETVEGDVTVCFVPDCKKR